MSVPPTPAAPAPPTQAERERVARAAGRLRMVLLSDAIPGRNGVGTYYDDLVQHLRPHLELLHVAAPPRDRSEPYGGLRLPFPGDDTQEIYVPWPVGLWRELTALRPHVVLSATPSAYGVLGMAVAQATGAGFCVGHHTQLEELAGLYWESAFGRVSRVALSLWDGLVRRAGATVLVHNAELVETMRAAGVGDVRLVGTPTRKEFLDRPPAPFSDTVRRVSFIGRLAPEKRVEEVVAVAEAMPELAVRIVGDGPLRPEVEAAAARLPNLDAVPWVERGEVGAELDDTDLLVLPSAYETFGTAALEAMARGRIAVVSARCGIGLWPELAPGLVRMDPGESLVAAVRRVRALPPEERAAIARAGRAGAEGLTRRTVEHWLGVLTSLAPPGSPA